MTTPQSDAASRLPVYTPLYYKLWNIIGRAYILDQNFNCRSFIGKKDLLAGQYIGGWGYNKHGVNYYYTANYDSTDGLYLTVTEEDKDNFIKSLKSCAPLKTDLKGFFNRELEAVGELNGMTVFYIGKQEDLFGTVYYYEPVYIQDENRIFIKYGKYHGRDFNFINGRWK